jgi:hypothetical protein
MSRSGSDSVRERGASLAHCGASVADVMLGHGLGMQPSGDAVLEATGRRPGTVFAPPGSAARTRYGSLRRGLGRSRRARGC